MGLPTRGQKLNNISRFYGIFLINLEIEFKLNFKLNLKLNFNFNFKLNFQISLLFMFDL